MILKMKEIVPKWKAHFLIKGVDTGAGVQCWPLGRVGQQPPTDHGARGRREQSLVSPAPSLHRAVRWTQVSS